MGRLFSVRKVGARVSCENAFGTVPHCIPCTTCIYCFNLYYSTGFYGKYTVVQRLQLKNTHFLLALLIGFRDLISL